MIQDPESLCAKILKAKYFPNTHILEAVAENGCYYTWRSIVQGIEVLKEGVIWRVGNGQNVNIWSDPWLPRGVTRRPITPRAGSILQKVVELFDPVTEQWDTQLLTQTFWEEDVKLIRSMPVHTEMDDVVGWHFGPKGKFSVRSAYKVHQDSEARKSQRVQPGDTEGSNGKTNFWQKLWNLDCPPKIKHFLWRLSQNTLAVKNILKRRGMKIDTCCSLCRRLDEDGGHLFLKCKEVKGVWRELNLEAVWCSLSEAGSAR